MQSYNERIKIVNIIRPITSTFTITKINALKLTTRRDFKKYRIPRRGVSEWLLAQYLFQGKIKYDTFLFGAFCENKTMLYCVFGTKLEKSHLKKKRSIEYCDFDMKNQILVFWEVVGEAIGRPPGGKIWSTWWGAEKENCCNKRISSCF